MSFGTGLSTRVVSNEVGAKLIQNRNLLWLDAWRRVVRTMGRLVRLIRPHRL